MKEYAPYGAPKVNIRSRGFDWDSNEPISGEVQKKDLSSAWHFAIDWTAAFTVTFIGWKLMEWWYYGGWVWMRNLFIRLGLDLMNMTEFGRW